jgi:ribosomal protein S18 acetylase RimI-like enzyme
MVRWTEAHLTATAPSDGSVAAYEAEVSSTDAQLGETLAALGYHPTGEAPYQLNLRELRGEIEEPVLPDGAGVRPVCFDDAAEVEARVALHREVWEPSRFTAEGYARLRTKPVYRPDLDLVAVTPEGDLASYCIVWWDPDTRTGEFEPVGTSSRFRRQGYGKALLLDGLRRLRAMGAMYAIVASETAPERWPSRRLYASAGFQIVTRFETWVRL